MEQNPNTPQPGNSLMALVGEAVLLEQKIIASAGGHAGEIDPELEAFLNGIQEGIQHKADSYKFIIDRLETSAEMLAGQADKIYAAAKGLETTALAMKLRIKDAMIALHTDEIRGVTWRYKMSTNPRGRLVLDLAVLKVKSPSYVNCRTQVFEEPDKDALKEALDAGTAVEGAKYEPSYTLNNYVNKGK